MVFASSQARSESVLELPVPTVFGTVAALTYDAKGERVGDATMRVEEMPDGTVRIEGVSGFEAAERTVVTADLERIDGHMRLLKETSESFDRSGQSMGMLTVDHAGGQGICQPASDDEETRYLELPHEDRIANVPLNLLLVPLARGEQKHLRFQLMICRGGPRLINAHAKVKNRHPGPNGVGEIVEVSYELDLGFGISQIAKPFIPNVAVWFDPTRPDAWVAHRMPLFSKGPEVLVVRQGIPLEALRDGKH